MYLLGRSRGRSSLTIRNWQNVGPDIDQSSDPQRFSMLMDCAYVALYSVILNKEW